jgi:hypothetical protein
MDMFILLVVFCEEILAAQKFLEFSLIVGWLWMGIFLFELVGAI